MLPLQALHAKMSFVVEGSETSYNRTFVINETSQPNIRCRVVILGNDDTMQEIVGVFNLSGINDRDSNVKTVKKGMRLGIEMPKDFQKELSFTVEYKDYPFYDAIVIHLYDKDSEF